MRHTHSADCDIVVFCSLLSHSRGPWLPLLSLLFAVYCWRCKLEASLRNMLQIPDTTPLVSEGGRLRFVSWC